MSAIQFDITDSSTVSNYVAHSIVSIDKRKAPGLNISGPKFDVSYNKNISLLLSTNSAPKKAEALTQG